MSNLGLLNGKVILIMGVANDMSIAWHIAKYAHEQGAELVFTYQSPILQKRVEPLAASLNAKLVIQCDATKEQDLTDLFAAINKQYGRLDAMVHAIAFSDKNELAGRCIDTSLDNFLNSMNVSVYTFLNLAKHAEKLMQPGGRIITLTYYGSTKVVPNYNVMGLCKAALEAAVRYAAMDLGSKGIHVNAISAGSIKTLASSAVSGIRDMIKATQDFSPLKEAVSQHDVAKTAAYLLSELSDKVTGQVVYVDSGYNILGMFAQ